MTTLPPSGADRPARMPRSVDLPLPIAPTIDVNVPRSTESDTSRRTVLREPFRAGNDLATPAASMKGTLTSHRSQPGFGQPHQAVQDEADDPDGDDGEQDVRVDQAVVFLPEESADARRARQHLAGDDDEPGDAEAQAVAREHVGKRGWHDDLHERRG